MPGLTIPELVLRRAELCPTAPAVRTVTGSATYGMLDQYARQLTSRLEAIGVRPGMIVGVCVERNWQLPAILVAIMRLGAAYLPLDPAYPIERLSLLVQLGAPKVMVASDSARPKLGSLKCPVISTDSPNREGVKSWSGYRPPSCDDLAYVLFTSGSTGAPKGVMIEHRSANALIHWATSFYPDEFRSRVFASSSICFDLSIFELFLPLCNGNEVILANNALELSAYQPTLINTVPTLLEAYLKTDRLPASVRVVNLVGEPLTRKLASEIYSHHSVERLYNLYGPTEDTTYTTVGLVSKDSKAKPSIGRPLPGKQVFIADDRLLPVPIGTVGEICISGDGLARGYLGAPHISAERFVETCYGRAYRTGDYGRILLGGEIEYIGRRDRQVKLRGFRIELPEIEDAMNAHPQVRQAVVTIAEAPNGSPQLVAYLKATSSHPDLASLRGDLARALPSFMVPSTFTVLEQFPTTPNGKLDLASLPNPFASALEGPQPNWQDSRRLVADAWASVLGSFPTDDCSFIEAGGDSLSASLLIARIRDSLQRRLPANAIYLAPTFKELVEFASAAPKEDPHTPTKSDVAPLSFFQEELLLAERLRGPDVKALVALRVKIEGAFDSDDFAQAVRLTVARHELLRARLTIDANGGAIEVSPHLDFHIPLVDLSKHLPLAVVEEIAEFERETIAYSQFPLFRARLVRLGSAHHLFQMVFHHAVADGLSTIVLFEELTDVYRRVRAGEPVFGRAYVTRFWEKAARDRDILSREGTTILERSCRRLSGLDVSKALAIPPPLQAASRRLSFLSLNIHSSSLKRQARECLVTPFTVALAGVFLAAVRFLGLHDIAIGTMTSTRDDAATHTMVGPLVNSVAVRVSVRPSCTSEYLIKDTAAALAAAVEDARMPIEHIARAISRNRSGDGSLLYHLYVNWLSCDVSEREVDQQTTFVFEPPEPYGSGHSLAVYFFDLGSKLQVSVGFDPHVMDADLAAQFSKIVHASLTDITSRRNTLFEPACLDKSYFSQVVLSRHIAPFAADELDFLMKQVIMTHANRSALCYSGETRTFEQIGNSIDRLSERILSMPASAESIAILTGNSSLAILAMFGALRAGITYVPLSVEEPYERLKAMLSAANVGAVLVDTGGERRLQMLGIELPVLRIDEEGGRTTAPGSLRNRQRTGPAYVLFTSGSTGAPKGVLQSRVNLLAHARAYASSLSLSQHDRVALLAGVATDAAVMDIFGAFVAGAQLLVHDLHSTTLSATLEQLADKHPTILHLTPSLFRALFRSGHGEPGLLSLRALVLGGEFATVADFELFQQKFASSTKFVNGYGPTECTTALQQHLRHDEEGLRHIPIGAPIGTVQVELVDDAGCRSPVTGEIFLRGEPVALGYIGQSEGRNGPFWHSGTGRGYRTGDIARRTSDGRLIYLGRMDRQIKLNGRRIELGEIEGALNADPGVRRAAVITDPMKGILAFIVLACEAADLTTLSNRLALRLPMHMMPNKFIPVADLPLTRTGKLDLAQLRELASSLDAKRPKGFASDQYVEAVWTAWRSGLEHSEFGLEQNFFEAGGNSLRAVVVHAALTASLGRDIPLTDLFQWPTVRDLANHLSRPEPDFVLDDSTLRRVQRYRSAANNVTRVAGDE